VEVENDKPGDTPAGNDGLGEQWDAKSAGAERLRNGFQPAPPDVGLAGS